MKRDITQYIAECQECQLATSTHKIPRALLKPIKVDRVLEIVTSDFMGPVKESRAGNINIIVLVDHKSKYSWFRATKDQTAKTTAPIIANIELEFGIFEKLLTDQGKNYESELIAELCHLLDTDKLRTTPFHPIGDGQSEIRNKSLIKMIKTFIDDSHENWDELLPGLEYAYNTSVHAMTGMSPYFIMFGRHPKCPEDLIFNKPEIDFPVSINSYAQQVKENLHKAFQVVKENQDVKTELSQIYYNRNNIACTFEVGETVWVRSFKPAQGACKKFSNKWKGPYEVLNRLDNLVYSLKPLYTKGKKITMHRNNLKRHIKRETATAQHTVVEEPPLVKPKTTNVRSAQPKKRGRPAKQVNVANEDEEDIPPIAQLISKRGRPKKKTKFKIRPAKYDKIKKVIKRLSKHKEPPAGLRRTNPKRKVNKNMNYNEN